MIDKNKDRKQEEIEKKLYDKVIKKDRDHSNYITRTILFVNEECLIESLRGLYPDLNELFIINLDQRDSNNVPLVKTKNFRTIRISHKTWKYNTGRIQCDLDLQIKMIIAVIENGRVFLKTCGLSNSYWNRHG